MNEHENEHTDQPEAHGASQADALPADAPPTVAPAAGGADGPQVADQPGSIDETPEPTLAEGDVGSGGPPVVTTPVASGRSGAARWGIALIVAALVAGTAAAAFVLSSAGAGLSRLAGYVPAGTSMYMELRADLPGDQRQKLGEVLANFPGFDDQANIEGKIDEALDRIVRQATSGEHDYSGEVKPWFGGELVVAVVGWPTLADGSDARFLWLTSVTDPAAAKTWLAEQVFSGASVTAESYGGVDLSVIDGGELQLAYGVGETVSFAGDLTSVEAAIDTKGNSAFASSQALTDAQAALPADRLGLFFLDYRQLTDLLVSGSFPGAAALPAELVAQAPPWLALAVRSESDALVFDMATPNTYEPGQMPPDKVSTLATRLPGATIVELEVRSLGQSIMNAIEQYRKVPEFSEAVGQVEQALAVLGGVDALTGWMGDATIVVARDGDTISGGLVIETSDEKAAGDRFVQLRNLLTLAGAGSGITIRDEPYGDGQITIVDLGDLADLAALSGQELPAPVEGRLELAYTVQKGLVIMSVGDGFVKSVLDTTQASSLAGQEQYKATMERAGKTNSSQMYVDLAGIRELVERLLPADGRAAYDRETKPYIEPIAALAASGTTTSERVTGRYIVTFK